EEFFLGVRNFTLGGLLFEYLGSELEGLNPGAKIEFDLVTNFGDKISGLSGKIAHITHEYDEHDCRLLLGIKLLPMSFLNETKYRELIREYCAGIKAGRT